MQTQRNDRPQPTNPPMPTAEKQTQKTRRRTKQSKITYSSYRKGKWKDPNRQTRIHPSQKRQMQKTQHKKGRKQRSPKATYINCRKIPCKALDEGQTHPICSIQPTGPRSSSLNQSSSPNQTKQAKIHLHQPRKNKRKIPTGTIPKHFLPQPTNPPMPAAEKQTQKTRRRTKQSKITYSSYRKDKWKDPNKGQHIKRTRGSKALYHPKTRPSQLIGKANAKNPTRPQRSGLGWLTQGLVFIE